MEWEEECEGRRRKLEHELRNGTMSQEGWRRQSKRGRTNNHLEPLHSLLLGDANIGLLQGDGPEAVVKEEEPLGGVHPEEGGHILVVGEGGRETHQADELLCGLDLTDGPGYNGFQDWTPIVMEEVDFILGKLVEGGEGGRVERGVGVERETNAPMNPNNDSIVGYVHVHVHTVWTVRY